MARKEGQAPPVVVVIEADCSSSPATETTRDHDAQMHGAPAQPKGASTPPSTSAQPGLTAGGEAYSSSGLTYDEALDQYVGQFGVGQLASFLLAGLVWIPNAVLILLLVFSIGSPATDRQWECVDPADASCMVALNSETPAADMCSLQRSQWRWTEPHMTITAQFDLICSDAWKAQVANSFFFLGYLIGSGVFGRLSDRFGRKACLFSAAIISAVCSAAGMACSSYWAWLVMRLLSGIGASGTSLCAYVLATEAIGAKWRGAAGIGTQVFFIAGEFVLVLVSVLFSSWRGQAAACAVLSASLLVLWPLLPESGRWLLAQGRKEEAMKVLEVFARRNGTCMPDRPLADMPPVDISKRLTLGTALRDWHIARRFLVLSYTWMVLGMAYYGISFALGGLGGSLMVSFIISAVAELPSYIFVAFAIDFWGRHNTMGGCTLLGGAACVGCAFVPAGPAQMGLASIGKFGISGAFAIATIYTSELFPTLIRSAVLGAENQAARVGAIAAPFIALAGAARSSSLIPFLTFGAAAIVAGVLIFTLPETLGTPLPDHMGHMGVIASIFTNKTLSRKGFKAAAASMFKTRVTLPGSGGAGGGGAPGAARNVAGGGGRGWWGGRGKGGGAGAGAGKGQEISIWEEDEVMDDEMAAEGDEAGEVVAVVSERRQGGAASSV